MASARPVADPAAPTGGGSGLRTSVGPRSVAKTATRATLAALQAEGAWLRWVRAHSAPEVARRFPRVLRSPTPGDPVLVLERVPGRDARTLLLEGHAGLRPVLREAIDLVVRDVFPLRRGPLSQEGSRWYETHLSLSVEAATSARPWLGGALAAREVVLDGAARPNPLGAVAGLVRRLAPREGGLVHGDLHLGNVVVDPESGSYALLDPRGGFGDGVVFDPAYDVAKLLHEPSYVAARAGLLRVELEATTRRTVVAETVAGGSARLERLSSVSCELARRAARGYGDPGVAARATLLAGVQLLTILRFGHVDDGAARALFAAAVRWVEAGAFALGESVDLDSCTGLWRGLLALPGG